MFSRLQAIVPVVRRFVNSKAIPAVSNALRNPALAWCVVLGFSLYIAGGMFAAPRVVSLPSPVAAKKTCKPCAAKNAAKPLALKPQPDPLSTRGME